MNWKNKICLGTAQFGKIYGITNKNKKQTSVQEIKKFLLLLKKNKIDFIDTALSYKNVDKKLSKTKINLNKFNIITKIPRPKQNEDHYVKKISKMILVSKEKLRIKSFYAVLLHDCYNLNVKEILKVKDIFANLKKKNLTKKIGISIYNIQELNFVLKFFIPDLIQIPLSIFDKRFLKKNILKKLSKYRIEVHVRSIFLQGLLLENYDSLKKQFLPWTNLFLRWNNYCIKYQISKLQAATNFIFNNNKVRKVIVGFANIGEFDEFLSLSMSKNKKIPLFKVKKQKNIEKLIKPYNWNFNK